MEGVSPIQPSTLARYEGDYEYNMKYPERGCFVIFNQKVIIPCFGQITTTWWLILL